jgi:hypothetical protein
MPSLRHTADCPSGPLRHTVTVAPSARALLGLCVSDARLPEPSRSRGGAKCHPPILVPQRVPQRAANRPTFPPTMRAVTCGRSLDEATIPIDMAPCEVRPAKGGAAALLLRPRQLRGASLACRRTRAAAPRDGLGCTVQRQPAAADSSSPGSADQIQLILIKQLSDAGSCHTNGVCLHRLYGPTQR